MPQFLSIIILFFFTLTTSTLYGLSASSPITMWVAIEINLLRIIPLIVIPSSFNQEPQAAFLYFCIQITGSIIFFYSFLPLNALITQNTSSLFPNLALFSLILKIGAAPCHFWVPFVIRKIPWLQCLILATWQKLLPIFLLAKLLQKTPSYSPLITIATITAIIGRLGGLNQTNIRPLLAFSSIQHLGWILIATLFRFSLTLIYMLIYLGATSILIIKLTFWSTFAPDQITGIAPLLPKDTIIFKIILLSISGLPPLVGFYPKLVILSFIAHHILWLPIYILILCNTISLAYYLRLFFTLSLTPRIPALLSPSAPFSILPLSSFFCLRLYLAPAIIFLLT